ncbi:MAG TPA: hypothetical protein VF170_17285, partial [Planctomycetaceae bacterium]
LPGERGTAIITVLLSAWLSVLGIVAPVAAADPTDRPSLIVVVGAPGTPEYESEFRRWADLWEEAAGRGSVGSLRIGESDETGVTDRERLRAALAERTAGREPLWVVLIGHGTFDGREAKFNLRGPDVSAAELAGWVAPVGRPVAVVNCASASGPFLNRLSGKDRVVVTAARSGDELNFARFGRYLAEAVADPSADLDKDDQVSLLEAYLTASARVEEFYRAEARLATEHALLDDNGDGLGTPADWFRGVRATKLAKDGAAPDGVRAHQWHLVPSDRERRLPPEVRRRRDELELAIAELRERKATLPEDDYYARLLPLTVELARLYRDLPDGPPDPPRSAGE